MNQSGAVDSPETLVFSPSPSPASSIPYTPVPSPSPASPVVVEPCPKRKRSHVESAHTPESVGHQEILAALASKQEDHNTLMSELLSHYRQRGACGRVKQDYEKKKLEDDKKRLEAEKKTLIQEKEELVKQLLHAKNEHMKQTLEQEEKHKTELRALETQHRKESSEMHQKHLAQIVELLLEKKKIKGHT